MVQPRVGVQPTLRRLALEPGIGINEVTRIAHASGSRPLLHHVQLPADGGPFQFQLTGDAGRTFTIQAATNLPDPWGAISFTNPASPPPPQQFFRTRSLA